MIASAAFKRYSKLCFAADMIVGLMKCQLSMTHCAITVAPLIEQSKGNMTPQHDWQEAAKTLASKSLSIQFVT